MSYQKTIIIGNVGGEVITRTTDSGKQIAHFGVAVNEKRNGERKAIWFQVAAWEHLAEIATAYVTKGQLLLVEGRIAARLWTDQQGGIQVSLQLTANNIRFLGSKPESSEVIADSSPP